MSHAHVHGSEHRHVVRRDADRRVLAMALGRILSFVAAEVAVGIFASSLALLSDAAHMLTDAGALALALVAARLAARPAGGAMTYGMGRAEILSAQANGAILLVLALGVVYAAIRRLVSPLDVEAVPVLVVALGGVAVNLLAARVLAGAERRSVSVEGSQRSVSTALYPLVGS